MSSGARTRRTLPVCAQARGRSASANQPCRVHIYIAALGSAAAEKRMICARGDATRGVREAEGGVIRAR